LTPELRELGETLDRFRECRSACDEQGLGVDLRRVGIAASIFHLRCVAVKSYAPDLQAAAFDGASSQLDTLNRAVVRLQEASGTPDTIYSLAAEIAKKAERALASITPTIE